MHRCSWDFCFIDKTHAVFPFVTINKIVHAMTHKRIALVYRYVDYYYTTGIRAVIRLKTTYPSGL